MYVVWNWGFFVVVLVCWFFCLFEAGLVKDPQEKNSGSATVYIYTCKSLIISLNACESTIYAWTADKFKTSRTVLSWIIFWGGLNLFQFLPCNFIAAKLKPTLSIAYAYTVGVCEIGQGFPWWFNLQIALFLLKGSMDMFETGSENEVLHSCDDVRKSHIMTSLLLYNTSIDASLVSGFVFHVISDWKKNAPMKYMYKEFNVVENDLILFPFFCYFGHKIYSF